MENITRFMFKLIFKQKGDIGPISEKSKKNFESILQHDIEKTSRTYNFLIGHSFRNIDKSIFEYKLDKEKKALHPTQYLSLLQENFKISEEYRKVIENIRNVNSHYVHTFDVLQKSKYTPDLMKFLKEAFQFAVVSVYLKENSISYADFKEDNESKIVAYLCKKFYPNEEHQKEERFYFLELTLNKAIEHLLFIEVKEDFEWKLENDHTIFPIKSGIYLSFHAQLFLLSLSLYKQEANLLISKMQGFKQSEDKLKYKREIFTFFSKKISSQDINNEERNLTRFRDIILYLNKYPTTWNHSLEPERKLTGMTNVLEKCVIESEILRAFPRYKNTPKEKAFVKYAVQRLFRNEQYLFNFKNIYYSDSDKKCFKYELYTSPKVKDLDLKIEILKNSNNPNRKDINELYNKKKKASKEGNKHLEKLKTRIAQNLILKSNGRNQDRFMQFAMRFLAETNYFGSEAKFKVYLFNTTSDQDEYLIELKKKLDKKQFDKLKYHQGRLVDYVSYSKHLENHKDSDTPFVIENNAVQLIMKLEGKEEKLVSIQRALLPYFLEDALYSDSSGIHKKGENLLKKYYNSQLKVDFGNAKNSLNPDSINTTHRKLLPKRLLKQYTASESTSNLEDTPHPYLKILEKAQLGEKRYQLLRENAEKVGLIAEFEKKNKGKNFKLRFVKKVWNLLFFSLIYEKRASELGHHKSLHITKEEFNNFCKWMYAFDEVPEYKNYLHELLHSKHFFNNKDFSAIFDKGKSLDDLYTDTKDFFQLWLQNHPLEKMERKNDYSAILDKKIVYINLSHFLEFLEKVNKVQRDKNNQLIFNAQNNIPYLIPEWYYKDILPKEEYTIHGKLFNKLRKIKLEDALLYEMAMYYLNQDKSVTNMVKTDVRNILTSTISLEIKQENNPLYTLTVPFSKLDALEVLYKRIQSNNGKKFDFTEKIPAYIASCTDSNIVKIQAEFKKSNTLSYEQFNLICSHIVTTSIKFSRIHINLERYYITKNKIVIKMNNRIDAKEIKDEKLGNVFDGLYAIGNEIRNSALHYDVPPIPYFQFLTTVERKLINNEVKPLKISSYSDLNPEIKALLKVFMKTLHSNLYKTDKNLTDEEKTIKFENEYFKKFIA